MKTGIGEFTHIYDVEDVIIYIYAILNKIVFFGREGVLITDGNDYKISFFQIEDIAPYNYAEISVST